MYIVQHAQFRPTCCRDKSSVDRAEGPQPNACPKTWLTWGIPSHKFGKAKLHLKSSFLGCGTLDLEWSSN